MWILKIKCKKKKQYFMDMVARVKQPGEEASPSYFTGTQIFAKQM